LTYLKKALSQNLPTETAETHENFSEDNRRLDRDSNRGTSPVQVCTELPPQKLKQCVYVCKGF